MGRLLDFLGGMALGAITGAAIAIVVAPDSGAVTRRKMRRRVNEALEEGRRAAAERRAELEAQFAQARQVNLGG
jgi:gas vesicle protein